MLYTITALPNDTTSEKLNSLIQTVLSTNVAPSVTEATKPHRVLRQDESIDANLNERINTIQDKSLCHK